MPSSGQAQICLALSRSLFSLIDKNANMIMNLILVLLLCCFDLVYVAPFGMFGLVVSRLVLVDLVWFCRFGLVGLVW